MPLLRSAALSRRVLPVGMSLVLLASACSDSTAPSARPGTAAPHVTASIAGSAWAANYEVPLAIGDLLDNGQRVEISGVEIAPDSAGRAVVLRLSGFKGTGTYALGPAAASGSAAMYVESPDLRPAPALRAQYDLRYDLPRAGAGTAVVTSYVPASGWIEGTFSLEVAQSSNAGKPKTLQITNGSFAGRLVRGQ